MVDEQSPQSRNRAQMGTASDREIELEILSNSWLSLSSASGYDAMLQSWARRIDASVPDNADDRLVDDVVLRQFEPIESLLGANAELRHADPLERETQLTASPVMILSPDGTVAAAANGGEDFFRIALGRRASLDWLCEESENDFAALRRNLLTRGNAGFAILKIVDPYGIETLAEAYGLTVDEYSGTFTVVRSLALEWKQPVAERLEQAYGMTPSETEIARLVFELRDLDEVASVRGVSIDTVRTQVKRIFAKLGLHSKAELVKLIAMLCARTMAMSERRHMTWNDPIGNEMIISRPDGRKLAYSVTGAADGRDVLFIHGDLPMFYLEPRTRQMLDDARVRLICLSMPGHGSSDPPPRGVNQMEDGLAAIHCALGSFGRGPLPIAASFSGMTFPMALGALDPPPISAILLIGLPWNLTPDTFRAMATNNKTITQLALRAPRILDLVARLGFRMMQRDGPDFYLSRALAASPLDRSMLTRADLQPYLRASVRHMGAQGHSAFVREVTKTAREKPAEKLARLKVPLHWLAPEEVTTSRPEFRAAARAMNPLITVETVLRAGELLQFQRPDVFVRALADLASDNPAERFVRHADPG